MKLEAKHWAVIAGLMTGFATQLLTAQHGWADIASPGFVAGMLIQFASAITAIFVGAPGATAALERANLNTDMANASTRAALADPMDLGKVDPKRFVGPGAAVLLACALTAGAVTGCASLPAKQRAVAGLQASELALEAAHDAERALCSPTADHTKAITHCDGAQAAAIGLTDARHQALARIFAMAFSTEIAAATSLRLWRAGDPPPVALADYQKDLHDVLVAVSLIVPTSEPIVTKLQAAVDAAAQVAVLAGVK